MNIVRRPSGYLGRDFFECVDCREVWGMTYETPHMTTADVEAYHYSSPCGKIPPKLWEPKPVVRK